MTQKAVQDGKWLFSKESCKEAQLVQQAAQGLGEGGKMALSDGILSTTPPVACLVWHFSADLFRVVELVVCVG